MIRIVGVLQNAWFHNPGRMSSLQKTDPAQYRKIWLAGLAHCRIGRHLRSIFGEQLYHAIEWEDSATSLTLPRDLSHLQRRIERSDIVVAFGDEAGDFVRNLLGERIRPLVVVAPNPAWRCGEADQALRRIADQLKISTTR